MKLLTNISKYLVGLLFIFSGLIKLNDPYGFSYKLSEYFDVFSADFGKFFQVFNPIALEIALLICIAEIVLGIAILIAYRFSIVKWIILSMILFFTFLTFYSAYFDKVKECGCFGDFISLTPWQSFWKDIILLVLILVLFAGKQHFKRKSDNLSGDIIVVISTLVFMYIGYYSITHLPYFDWRPYAIGKNIRQQMTPEESPIFVYIMEKNGQQTEMTQYPSDTTYKYISYKVLNPEKSQPKIMDYQIWNDEGDFNEYSLQEKVLFLVIRNAEKALKNNRKEGEILASYINDLEKSGIKPMIITSSQVESIENLRHETQLAVTYYYMDETQIKTMIRANFGLMLLNNGTILGKWNINDLPEKNEIIKLAE
jgi:uncharacterized membrane protein YphA (DoxX/SURF4 family)